MSDWSFEDFYLWKNTYAACSALEQSPININTDVLKDCNLMCQLKQIINILNVDFNIQKIT